MYGILTAIQGCEAFKDLMINTKIQSWFERMKNLIEPHRIDTPVRSISYQLAFTMPFAVIFQELFRYLFYRVIK